MNNTIAASHLAEMLARRTGISVDEASAFIGEYFNVVRSGILSGEEMHLKGLGTFRATGNASSPVEFVPDPALTAKVNAPFAAFSPFVLESADEAAILVDMPETPLEEEPKAEEPKEETPLAEVPTEAEKPEPETVVSDPEPEPEAVKEQEPEPEVVVPEPVVISAPEPVKGPEPVREPEPEPVREPEPVNEPEPEPANESEDSRVIEIDREPAYNQAQAAPQIIACPAGYHNSGMKAFWFIIAFALGIIIGFGAGYYFHGSLRLSISNVNDAVSYPDENKDEEDKAPEVQPAKTAEPAAADKPAAQATDSQTPADPTQPAQTKAAAPEKPVYDTIDGKTFLTTLAGKHYGQKDFWVYIYEANPKLGNPNRIKPGTKVLIPPMSQLPLTGNTEKDINAAKAKQAQIYGRYTRK